MAQALMIDAAQSLTAPGWGGIPLFKLAEDYTEGPGKLPLRYVARYLTAGATGKDATPLTAAEAAYLATQGAAILPVWNAETGTSVSGTYADGQAAFAKCAAALAALGVPANAYYALDIETGWPVSPEWLLGWVDAARASIYGGAGVIYGTANTLGPALRRARVGATAAQAANLDRVLLWIANWEYSGKGTPTIPLIASALPAMDPATLFPDAPGQVMAWQYATGCVGGLCDQSVLDLGRVAAPGFLWAPKAPETQKKTTPAPTKEPVTTLPPTPVLPPSNLPPGWVNAGGQVVTPGGLVFVDLVQAQLVPGQYRITLPVTLSGPGGATHVDTAKLEITEDTGDWELMVSPAIATELGLPHGATLDVSGVNSTAAAYESTCGVSIGNLNFSNVHCFVMESAAGLLFGLRFYIDRQVGFRFDPTTYTWELYMAP